MDADPKGAVEDSKPRDAVLIGATAELLNRWRSLVVAMIAAVVVAGALALALPDRYTARTVLYLPQPQTVNPLEALTGQLPTGVLRLGQGGGQDTRMIFTILESRTLRDSLVSRHGPIRNRDVRARRDPEGSIVIEVSSRDPRTAVQIANSYPDLLNLLALRVSSEANSRRTEFLRHQLEQAHEQLAAAEDRLLAFQLQSGAPDVEEQGRRTIEAAADIQRRVTEMEIEISQLRRVVTPSNPRLQAAEAELQAWRAQLRRITAGREPGELLLSLEASPELRAAAYRLARDFQTNEQVVLSLTAALTQAQLDSRDDLPIVSVIDPAVAPRSPAGPGLPLVLAVAAVLGLVVGSIFVIVGSYWSAARMRPENRPIVEAWERFRTETGGLRSRRDRSPEGGAPVDPDPPHAAVRSPAE